MVAIDAEQADPGFWNDQEKAQATIGELKGLTSVVGPLDEAIAAADDLPAAFEMADEDEAFEEEVRTEIARIEAMLEKLKLSALLSGPNDAAGAIIQINARDGGTDANDWAEMLLRMYIQWAGKTRATRPSCSTATTTKRPASTTPPSIAIRGPMAYGYLKRRDRHAPPGADQPVQLRRQTPDELRRGRRHARDLGQRSRSRSPRPTSAPTRTAQVRRRRGQHVNKTDSAVRLTHLPTGIGRAVPERALAAQEPRQRLEDAPREASHSSKKRSEKQEEAAAKHGQQAKDRLRQPDPQLLPAPGPAGEGHADEVLSRATSTRCWTATSRASSRPCSAGARGSRSRTTATTIDRWFELRNHG